MPQSGGIPQQEGPNPYFSITVFVEELFSLMTETMRVNGWKGLVYLYDPHACENINQIKAKESIDVDKLA